MRSRLETPARRVKDFRGGSRALIERSTIAAHSNHRVALAAWATSRAAHIESMSWSSKWIRCTKSSFGGPPSPWAMGETRNGCAALCRSPRRPGTVQRTPTVSYKTASWGRETPVPGLRWIVEWKRSVLESQLSTSSRAIYEKAFRAVPYRSVPATSTLTLLPIPPHRQQRLRLPIRQRLHHLQRPPHLPGPGVRLV
jgi:hypothetical protein